MLIELEITRIVPPAQGLGHYRGKAVFVPGTAVGDRLEAVVVREKKDYLVAEMHRLLQASPDRVEAPCPYVNQCGGCDLMHLAYPQQLALKTEMLGRALAEARLEARAELIPSPQPLGFRYRCQWTWQQGKLGYLARNSHRLIPVDRCPILSAGLNQQFERVSRLFYPDGEFSLLESRLTHEIGVSCRQGRETFPVPGFPEWLVENYGFGELRLQAGLFAQSNPFVTELLIRRVVDRIQTDERVTELFCGCGTFTIPVAQKAARVIGYEISPPAVEAARQNIRLNRLTNVQCRVADTEKLRLDRETDCVLLDPPRTGLGRKIKTDLIAAGVKKIIYLSCNPATLIRDLVDLTRSDCYQVVEINGYDMYAQSSHLEVLAVLTGL